MTRNQMKNLLRMDLFEDAGSAPAFGLGIMRVITMTTGGSPQLYSKHHCSEENGVIERANRTPREKLGEIDLKSRSEAPEALSSEQSKHTRMMRRAKGIGGKGGPTSVGLGDAIDKARWIFLAVLFNQESTLSWKGPTDPQASKWS